MSEITLKQGRDQAAKHRVEIREGGDPGKRIRQAKASAARALVVEQLAEDFLSAKVRSGSWGKKHSTESHRRMMAHVVPALGKREPADITRADVNRLQIRLGESTGPVEANRIRSLLHHFLEWAREEDHFPEDQRNPAAVSRTSAVKPFPETSRDRWLHHKEAPRLFVAADQVASGDRRPLPAGATSAISTHGAQEVRTPGTELG